MNNISSSKQNPTTSDSFYWNYDDVNEKVQEIKSVVEYQFVFFI
ncbi:MAG: hypothetical protein ACI4N3_02325 [Alphaproteobacteria bacterium]